MQVKISFSSWVYSAMMLSEIPFFLIIAWIVFFGSVNTHQRHDRDFRGASQGYHLALKVSHILGTLVGLGLIIYYFMQVAWYWPFALFAVGILLAGLLFGLLDRIIGALGMSMLAFIAWPVAAVWAFIIIHGLKP